jgi:hypothetical protein
MDAREFVKMLVCRDSKDERKVNIPTEMLRFNHCFMNLPMDAVEFLDVFVGLFNKADPQIWQSNDEKEIILPLIHVYGFTYEKDT